MVLLVMGAVGMTIRQLPSFAFRTPADYASRWTCIHQRYDPLIGRGVVGLLERAQVFKVFSSWWFSAALVVLTISIVCCTLDRTPRLWRQVARHPGRPAGSVLRSDGCPTAPRSTG